MDRSVLVGKKNAYSKVAKEEKRRREECYRATFITSICISFDYLACMWFGLAS